MTRLAAMAVTFVLLGFEGARARLRDQDGEAGVTLEQVVWAVALLAIATIAVAVITAAIQSRLSQIN